MKLERGRFPAATLHEHLVTALVPEFEALAEREREQAERDGLEWPARLSVRADRATPFASLMHALHAASRAGYFDYALRVVHRQEPGELSFSAPLSWLPGAPTYAETQVEIELRVSAAGELELSVGDDTQRLRAGDLVALEQAVRAVKAAHPELSVVTLRADEAVPLQQIVALLDTLRGRECWLDPTANEVAEDCLLWQPILDFAAPEPRRPGDRGPGDRDALRVRSMSSGELDLGLGGPHSPERHQAAVEAALPDIRACLLESAAARSARAGRIEFRFGVDARGRASGRVVVPDFDDAALRACLGAAVGLTSAPGSDAREYAYVALSISLAV